MEFVKTEKKFTLYINGEAVDIPQDPTYKGDLIRYQEGMDIRVGETISGKELMWELFQDGGRTIWVCNRNLINYISRDDCERLIHPIEIEGKRLQQSLPDAGCGTDGTFESSDWVQMVEQLTDVEKVLHSKECYSHTLRASVSSLAVVIGCDGARRWGDGLPNGRYDSLGWRPVLVEETKNCQEDIETNNVTERRSFLEIVEELMDQGWDEESACREAYAELYADSYDPEDYE